MSIVEENKQRVIDGIPLVTEKLNEVLNGHQLGKIETILRRIDRSGSVPPWFVMLRNEGRLPNLDGKTVGSVVEKLLVCILEKYIFNSELQLSINPAHGVDIPELKLGVKSPSTNFDTSEPFFSAYERLLGNEYDAIILLTNYQEAKEVTPFRLQILKARYLEGTEIADKNLCAYARLLREKYPDELFQKKVMRFLSYVNHSDWEAKCILKLFYEVLIQGHDLTPFLLEFEHEFTTKNRKNLREGKVTIPQDSLERLKAINNISPTAQAIINAAENWVILTQKDNGRYPNENEWHRFQCSPLNGKISMSFALQWRYNFKSLFSE